MLLQQEQSMSLSGSLSSDSRGSTLSIIPKPNKIARRSGSFLLVHQSGIAADSATQQEAKFLADRIFQLTGFPCPVIGSGSIAAPHIDLALDDSLTFLGNEGYHLRVAPEFVKIKALCNAGLFYGIQTLLQILPAADDNMRGIDECLISCVEIEDRPRFSWRGAMLDVSRHFLPKEFILKFIDLLAMHKMNVLHLHLTDDQGWRIEIKKYPRLTSVGAKREKTLLGRALTNPADADFDPASQRFDDVPYGGYYTQEQAREIVAYAASRHITVIPEIEMPGHAQAAIAAYPFLGCTGESLEVSPRWGIHDALYLPTERTFAFLRDVLAEVMEIFPSPLIHIGGDEAVKAQWRNSREVQALKNALGLRDEEAMQSYFIRRIDDFLTRNGRTLVGWDEILEGGLSPGAVVMSWRGEQGGVKAAEQGHDVVMAPHRFTYFDYYQADDRGSEPLALPVLLTLPTVYSYEPIPTGMPQECERHVLGTQCQLWSEYMPNAQQVEYMAFPRLSALSEVAWTSRENKDYDSFKDRLRLHLMRLGALDVNYRHIMPA
jgi:hexosaminidase